MLTVGSLFSGIGGFDLGLERAGMRTVWFCEQDPFCQRVLARHWPGVSCYPDVRALVGQPEGNGRGPWGAGRPDPTGAWEPQPDESLRSMPVPVPPVDVLAGGFPCQDISLAGRGAGLAGERSGLWREFARLIGELRPRYVIVENVPAITSRGGVRVLEDLASLGFDAEWDCLSAAQFGAPHQRLRFWLVAYPQGDGRGQGRPWGPASGGAREPVAVGALQDVGHADVARLEGHRRSVERAGERVSGSAGWWLTEPDVRGVVDGPAEKLDGGLNGRQGNGAVADPGSGAEGHLRDVWQHVAARAASSGRGSDEQLARELADALSVVPHGMALGEREGAMATAVSYVRGLRAALSSLGAVSDSSQPLAPAWLALPAEDQGWIDLAVDGGQWAAEWPGVGRVSRGVPDRVDRLRALGNALVPQIAEWIGCQIIEWEALT